MKTDRYVSLAVLVMLAAAVALAGSSAKADFTFGKAQNLGPVVNSGSPDAGVSISADGLTLHFMSTRPGGFGNNDIWVTTRSSVGEPWGPPVNLGGPVNSPVGEAFPCLSADGLTLYFSDYYYAPFRPGSLGTFDLWMSTRASQNDPWGTPVNMGATVNSSTNGDVAPRVSRDGLELVFCSVRPGGPGNGDLHMSMRLTTEDPWGIPMNMGATINSFSTDSEPCFSPDGLYLIFCSNRPGGIGSYDLWMTTRKSRNDPWRPPVNLGASVNTASDDGAPAFSPDMKTLYFASNRPGGHGGDDLYEVPILPVVDFDGDGIIAISDLVRLIESWGKDDPTVDIGPLPWGDGTVDAQDLQVFMEYWGQEIPNPALTGHWKLDEASGAIAGDSIGTNHAALVGNPVWQPAGGKVKGALLLDGIDDSITTPFVLNPGKTPFSVFLWVKGGGPGQVILSQVSGTNWLRAAPTSGRLQTELNEPGRNASKHLQSAVVITDGAWHRVGLVWDGANRALYVDEVEVARGAQARLPDSLAGLYIGADGNLTPGTFWSGLIDDVRIYDRAVRP